MSRRFVVSVCAVLVASLVSSAAYGQCQTSTGPDVIVGRVGQNQGSGDEITNYTASGTLEAFSMGTTSCNIGTVNVTWLQSPNPNHPVVGQNLFRMKTVNGATRFEQVGMGWLKHTFTALTQTACCTCNGQGGTVLGVGCSDPYTASRNGGQSSAGPKWQINATIGTNIQPVANPSFSGSTARRCEVLIADLEAAANQGDPVKYFGECQYVTADDAANGTKNNNASYRQIKVTGSGTAWTFGYFGSGSGSADAETHRQQAAIRAWGNNEAGVTYTDIVTPENANADPDLTVGLVILAAKATDLGGGQWHYEYAAQNLNSDRSVYSFSIPVPAGVTVTNIGFHDISYRNGDGEGSVNRDGTDWPGVRNTNDVTWACTQTFAQNANANALRWGTLYNFRFDTNSPPNASQGTVTLGQYKVVNNVNALTVVPGDIPCQPPVLTLSGQYAACSVPFTYNSSVTGTGPFNWSLTDAPAGMTIDSNGQISWPDPVNSIDAYQFSVTAASTCNASFDTELLAVRVTLGDFNADGAVNELDADVLASQLVDLTPVTPCNADLNNDGSVDGLDIDAFLALMGL